MHSEVYMHFVSFSVLSHLYARALDTNVRRLPTREECVVVGVSFVDTSKVLVRVGEQPAIAIAERLTHAITALWTQEEDPKNWITSHLAVCNLSVQVICM